VPLLLALVAAGPARAVAQPMARAAAPVPAVRAHLSDPDDPADDNRWRVDRCLFGLSYHSATRVTAAIAAGVRRSFAPRSVCAYGAAHLGLGGARATVGSAVTLGHWASAIGVSGGVLRTFGSPAGEAVPWRTYVGGSVHLWPLLGLHSEVGAYQRLGAAVPAGQDGGARRLLVWSVGFGY
jgi:hypothetical protein